MQGPLAGLKILDFSTLLPGPFATMLLADLGADVLHIEAPNKADVVKELSPQLDSGVSASYAYLHRGKNTRTLDLKTVEGLREVEDLLLEYDIVVEQFRPGVMAKFGLDYQTLSTRFPKLIYCSITGYGQSGPLAEHAGHDINYLALSGVANSLRRAGERPVASSLQLADIAGGALHAVIGLLAAVIERGTIGKGQQVDISMLDAALSLHPLFGPMQLATNQTIEPEAEALNGGSFYDYYETKDGRYVGVGSLEPKFQQRLSEVLAITDWFELDDVMKKQRVAQAIYAHDFSEWQAMLRNEPELCITPVLTFLEATQQPHAQARGLVENMQLVSPLRFIKTSTEKSK